MDLFEKENPLIGGQVLLNPFKVAPQLAAPIYCIFHIAMSRQFPDLYHGASEKTCSQPDYCLMCNGAHTNQKSN